MNKHYDSNHQVQMKIRLNDIIYIHIDKCMASSVRLAFWLMNKEAENKVGEKKI